MFKFFSITIYYTCHVKISSMNKSMLSGRVEFGHRTCDLECGTFPSLDIPRTVSPTVPIRTVLLPYRTFPHTSVFKYDYIPSY